MKTNRRTSTAFPPRRQTKPDGLLDRINARRKAIEKQKGLLPESYPLIREDRMILSLSNL